MILAIDPGKWAWGWALSKNKLIVACGLARVAKRHQHQTAGALSEGLLSLVNSVPLHHVLDIDSIFVEYPQHRDKENIRDQDIIDLAVSAGATMGLVHLFGGRAGWALVKPETWKKQQPKDICNARILAALELHEIDVYTDQTAEVPEGLLHNVVDAIGINLWANNRLPWQVG